MRNISLASYNITVRKKNARKTELTDDVDGSDLFDLFDSFLTAHKTTLNDTAQKMLLKVRVYKRSGRSCYGVIETGEYGYSADLVDVDDLRVSYARKPTEALMLPFFFHVYVPKRERDGLLVLQRFGNFGIRGVFAAEFKKFFADNKPEFTVGIDPIVHPEQLATFAKGGVVKRVTFRQRELPRDICDAYGGADPKGAYVEYAIVAKRDSNLPMFKRILRKLTDRNVSRPHIIDDPPNFASSQVLIEVELNGHTRTIDVQNTGKLRAYFDITDKVTIGRDGHPTFKSVFKESRQLIADIWKSLKGPANVR